MRNYTRLFVSLVFTVLSIFGLIGLFAWASVWFLGLGLPAWANALFGLTAAAVVSSGSLTICIKHVDETFNDL